MVNLRSIKYRRSRQKRSSETSLSAVTTEINNQNRMKMNTSDMAMLSGLKEKRKTVEHKVIQSVEGRVGGCHLTLSDVIG